MFFVEGEVVFDKELGEFFFEGFGAVVFALVTDVGGDGLGLGFADGEDAVAGLP